MRKIFLFVVSLFAVENVFSQGVKSCCIPASSTREFAMLASDPKFVSTHVDPIPFLYAPAKGTWISFKTSDGQTGRAFEARAEKPTNNFIFLFHEWWGLNDYMVREAENLQKELGNVTVIALDLYDKKIAATADEAGKMMGQLKQERATAIVQGALQYVGSKARIGTIGWCMGGGWSLQASLLAGKQAVACVMYYGMPEKDTTRLKGLNALVLFIFADQDQWINKQVLEEFQNNMRTAVKSLDVKSYAADHAFANPSNPKFNKEFSQDAHKNAVEFFKKNLLK